MKSLDYNIEGADCGRFPVKPKSSPSGKMPTENHRCRTCILRQSQIFESFLCRKFQQIYIRGLSLYNGENPINDFVSNNI
jgi:hypothetical protein